MRTKFLAPLVLTLLAAPSFADDVKLVTGETLKGTVVSRDASGIVLDHPVLGRITIPNDQVAPPAPPPPAWKFRVEVGASGSSGNTDQSDLHAAIAAVNDTDTGTLHAAGGWLKSETDDETTKNQQYVEAIYDFKIDDSRWSPFVQGRLDWDEFQAWDRRGTVGAGVGYLLVDDADFKARARAGLAFTKEWGSGEPHAAGWRPEGLAGAEFTWKVDGRNTVEGKATYYPDLDAGGEYRLVGSLSWAVRLSDETALSLKVGVEDEYDTHKEDPFEKNDFRYFAAILWEF